MPEGASQPADSIPGNLTATTIIWKFLSRVLPGPDAIPTELSIWHPELDPSSYVSTGTYPRCWIYQAALILALDHPDYANSLLDIIRQESPELIEMLDSELPRAHQLLEDSPGSFESGFQGMLMRDGTLVSTGFVEKLSDWRRVLDSFMPLDRGPSKSMPRSFALGLLVAFRYPTAARVLVNWMHVSERSKLRMQVKTTREFIDANLPAHLRRMSLVRGLSELLPLDD